MARKGSKFAKCGASWPGARACATRRGWPRTSGARSTARRGWRRRPRGGRRKSSKSKGERLVDGIAAGGRAAQADDVQRARPGATPSTSARSTSARRHQLERAAAAVRPRHAALRPARTAGGSSSCPAGVPEDDAAQPGAAAVADRQRHRAARSCCAGCCSPRRRGWRSQQPLGDRLAHRQQRLPRRRLLRRARASRCSTPTPRRRPGARTRSSSAAAAPTKDPTWQAKGIDSKGIQGRRLDWLIGDDLITPANAFSPAKRESALRVWDMQITTRLVEAGPRARGGQLQRPARPRLDARRARQSYSAFKRPACFLQGSPEVAVDPGDPRAEPLWPNELAAGAPAPREAGEAQPLPAHLPAVGDRRAGREAAGALGADHPARAHPDHGGQVLHGASTRRQAARPTTWTSSTSRSGRCTGRSST